MSRSQRTKGAAWERAVRDLFTAAMPGATVRRGLGQARSGGEVADVDCPVFWVECKVGKMPNPRTALEQAKVAAPPGRIPIAVVKDDRCEPFVALALDDFLDFVKEWWHERRGIPAVMLGVKQEESTGEYDTMKQRKTFADFREEWTALNRKLRVMLPNYSARRAVKVGDETWTVVADMGCELVARPRVTVLNPPDWTAPTLTDADGKAIEPPMPSEVQEALTALNAGMKAFFDGTDCFPEGDMEGIGLVLPEEGKV